MIKVYLASPYTIGDVAENVKLQMDTANELFKLGYNCYVPLYSHFQHMAHPMPYQHWIDIDLDWVKACDCVLRLGGDSTGADGEVVEALMLDKPVFYSINELSFYMDKNGK